MSIRILLGDVREKLAELPDESVHCVVTSPPYFGLRDYGTASWEGGDPACSHLVPATGSTQNKGNNGKNGQPFRDTCGLCNATRTDKQIGLEPTPAEFVAVMVDVFREVRRVLRKDGTLFLNLGDSYAGGGGHSPNAPSSATSKSGKYGEALKEGGIKPSGLIKQKDLIGIPWMVAFALRADGWYLRQDIIWSKLNPMPESVTDRCTKSHEYLFLLTRSARYHYDAEAIAEALMGEPHAPGNKKLDASRNDHDSMDKIWGANGTRNRRSVWTVATQPFSEAHFATFPPALIEPCILAGCPKDCCAKCGAPVVREVTASGGTIGESWHNHQNDLGRGQRGGDDGTNKAAAGWKDYKRETTGWSPSCSCDAGLARGVCLDPFGGAGTTGLVADRLQRDAILIELNPEYAAMAKERLTGDAPLFAVVV